MKILAGFYTNNRIRPQLLDQSLKHFLAAAGNAPVIPIVSSWKPIRNLPCQSVLSHFQLEGHGHLNILLQLLQIVQCTKEQWDYFAFCEHDCLYPPDYFANAKRMISETRPPGLATENHIGLFPNGFAHWLFPFHPLFAMTVRKDCLLRSLQEKLGECAKNGWCCLEPGNRTNWLIVSRADQVSPIVHVNMNTTANNHHLTNMYDFYCIEEAEQRHPCWGDFRRLGVFTDAEMEEVLKPLLSGQSYRIVDATYGHFDSARLVTYMPALKRKGFRGLFRVSNKEANSDPAPGVLKSLRLEVVLEESGNAQTYVFTE